MELLPCPHSVHVRDCPAQDIIGSESDPRPTEPPLSDNDAGLPLCPPPAAQLVEFRYHQGNHIDDVESVSPQNALTPDCTGIPYRQRVHRLLNIFPITKVVQARIVPLCKLPAVAQVIMTRVRRLRKLPHLVWAIQAHIEQVSKITHVVQAIQASIERLSRIPPSIQTMRQFLEAPAINSAESPPALRSKRCCFICITMSGRETVAMNIPCPRPKSSETKDRETKIYEIIKERLTIYYGIRRFLPFYGVQEVQEVNFQFTSSVADSHGSFPVVVHPLLLEQIQEKANYDIEYAGRDMDGPCYGSWHTATCDATVEDTLNDCIHERSELAERRSRNMHARHMLLGCVRSGQAKVLGALEFGWVQKSCVIRTSTIVLPSPGEVYNHSKEHPGLQISIGWQHDRIKWHIPCGLVGGFVAVSVVSLRTAWWMNGTNDMSTALAFGQLVAALIALVFMIADR